MRRALIEHSDPCGIAPAAREVRAGRATGRLIGGNLALVAALCGTPFAPDFTDAIVILEDVNEPLYKVDRMLQQLLLNGALGRCRAIVLGDCKSSEENESAADVDELLTGFCELLGLPCLSGVPVGHIAEQWTIPLGATAMLDTAERKLEVLFR